jgi:hypothetical protein
MLKKFINFILFCATLHIVVKADPNTLVNCNTDQDCQKYGAEHNLSCKKRPDFNDPVAKCQSKTLGARTVKYCVCEYVNAKSKQKNVEGMYDLFTGCSNAHPCSALGASCSTGAKPQCDAIDNGICYCPF